MFNANFSSISAISCLQVGHIAVSLLCGYVQPHFICSNILPLYKDTGRRWVSRPFHVKETAVIYMCDRDMEFAFLFFEFIIGFCKCSDGVAHIFNVFHFPNTGNRKYIPARTITHIKQHYENPEYCSDWSLVVHYMANVST